MNYTDIAKTAADLAENLIYVSDPHTYELCYANDALLMLLGIEDAKDILNKPCYEVLQGKSAPCEFCTNDKLTEGTCEWRHFNPLLKKWYGLIDKFIVVDGKTLRMEIGSDITSLMKTEKELTQKLLEEETLSRCIQTLYLDTDHDNAFYNLLEVGRKFHDADRACIFEFIHKKKTMNNLYEVCAEGIASHIEENRNLPLEDFKKIVEFFEIMGVATFDLRKEPGEDKLGIFASMRHRNCKNVICIPLFNESQQIIGFISYDNPRKNLQSEAFQNSISGLVSSYLEKTKLLAEMQTLSYIDSLTGVKNRQSFAMTLKRIEVEYQESVGVVCVDMIGLKEINESKGNELGNKLLIILARAMRETFGELVFRVGGDEFVAIDLSVKNEDFTKKVADFNAKINKVDDMCVAVGHGWKISTYNLPEFIEKTDNLRHVNKELYYQNTGKKHRSNKGLADAINEEIADQRYTIYLQPQYELQTGRIKGAEALIRKFGADGAMMSPIEFIPLYEKEGVIDIIDMFVLERVCSIISFLEAKGFDSEFMVSVNISRYTLSNIDIADRICKICDKYRVSRNRICIEVTETIEEDEGVVSVMLEKIRQEGFAISLDDFGVGQSNFTLLTEMNFSEVKLDKSLVDKITFDNQSYVLVKHFVSLCNDLNIKHITAEGIETKEQADLLRQVRCGLGQGYYFSRPLPFDEFLKKCTPN